MKKTLLLLFSLVFFIACSKEDNNGINWEEIPSNTPEVKEDPETQEPTDETPEIPVNEDDGEEPKDVESYYNPNYDYDGAIESLKVNETVGTINEPYSFAPIIDSDIWLIPNTDTRIAACQVPEDILKNLTTEALVTTCLRYPWIHSYDLAFKNFIKGIRYYIDSFNGFKELQSRPDAVYELLKKLRELDPVVIAEDYRKGIDYGLYYPDKSIFTFKTFDVLLASNYFPQIFEGKALEVLHEIIRWQYHQQMQCYILDYDRRAVETALLGAQIRLHINELSEWNATILETFINIGYYFKDNEREDDYYLNRIWNLIRIE
ncbi:MAG: hypothetical protein J6T82_02600 [Bacteroidaceae bacterium]|nr:hypothetical protein [Bacteroidaceae bacterium]